MKLQMQRARQRDGKVKVAFFPGCLLLSLVLSVVGTILLNVVLRLFD